MKVIVRDTTNVNAGKINGVVIKLKDETVKRGFHKPHYIACQHHILDKILKYM